MNAFEDERILVRACTEGDPRAWEAFVDRYSPFIDACVRKTLARHKGRYEPDEAETLFQDVFWELFRDGGRALKGFSWKSKLTTYLWVIASRRAAEHVAAARKSKPVDLQSLQEPAEPAVPGHDPAECAEREEFAALVLQALEDLPARDRKVLHLFYFDELALADVAKNLGISPAAAGMAVHRGRKKVEVLLRKSGKTLL
jgi:RNA polymerase sigma factor (sigma-70 family)